MLVYRVIDETGTICYKDEYDRTYSEIFPYLNGKLIGADVVRADSDNGYIEIEVPDLNEDNQTFINQSLVNLVEKPKSSKMKLERRLGKVKIMVAITGPLNS
jgi:hypothetical protein